MRIAREGTGLELGRDGVHLRIAAEGPRLRLARHPVQPDEVPANAFVTESGQPFVTEAGEYLVAT